MNVYSVSIKGHRDQNEDKHDIILNNNGHISNKKKINFYAVYDGHGGKKVSAYIQKNLEQYFTDKRIMYPLSKKYVLNVYDNLQKKLYGKDFAYHSGSTALVVIQFKYNGKNYLNLMNTGDSRCVLCRENIALPLTKDHKPHWPEERHRIAKLGGTIKFDGYDWRIKDLSVSRAFGDIDSSPYVTHRPELFRYEMSKSDKFIVIACDGLWDVLSNSDVVNFILINCYNSTFCKRINTTQNIAKKLAQHALKKGSTDNITILIVFFK